MKKRGEDKTSEEKKSVDKLGENKLMAGQMKTKWVFTRDEDK